jgi:molecular chaperone DnaK (HSP70)
MRFDNVFLGLGDELCDVTLPARDLLPENDGKDLSDNALLYVVLIRPRSLNAWLGLELGSGLTPASGQALQGVLQVASIQRNPQSEYLGFQCSKSQAVKLLFTFKTSEPAFAEWVANSPQSVNGAALGMPAAGQARTASLNIDAITAILDQKKVVRRPLKIEIAPLTIPADFPGVVAIDLGNVNTTIACLERNKTLHSDVSVIDPRPKNVPTAKPVPTALRVLSSTIAPAMASMPGNAVPTPMAAVASAKLPSVNPLTASAPPLAATGPTDSLLRTQGARSQGNAPAIPPRAAVHPEAAMRTAPPLAQAATPPGNAGPVDPMTLADAAEFHCLIGEDALRDPQRQRHVVLGAKRMLMDQPQQHGFALNMDRGSLVCHRRLLAELFLTETLRGFAKRTRQFPKRVVLTCPTTFAPKEHANLCLAVERAMSRARGGVPSAATANSAAKHIDAVVDEATAAAFYFIYRDFISQEGGVPGFTYELCKGGYILVVDCGGGTTDIALVNVKLGAGQSVMLEVIGRAGHRSFGGDYITKQLFSLLKAKMLATDPRFGYVVTSPGNRDWREFLRVNRQKLDEQLPTRFDPRKWQDHDNDRRRDATRLLWQLAEDFKLTLSSPTLAGEGEDTAPRRIDANTDVSYANVDAFRQLDARLPPTLAAALGVAENAIRELQVSRQELNLLIQDEAKKTVAYANHLVRRLQDKYLLAADGEVQAPPAIDRVYLVGNGSLYPFVGELFRQRAGGLAVPFVALEDGGAGEKSQSIMARVEPEDMKAAVVKGALLAQAVRVHGLNVDVQWDRELINKLPFDIVHLGVGYVNGYLPLYTEGTRYEDCVGKEFNQTPPAIGSPEVRAITLHKRWPGDQANRDSPLGTATFKSPVSGQLKLDFREKRFWLTAVQSEECVPVVAPPEPDPLGPVQSGEL